MDMVFVSEWGSAGYRGILKGIRKKPIGYNFARPNFELLPRNM
jgi:hypothetical protein